MIEGVASVDESAITGESAPVIRESGGDRSAVTGGTKVLSDRILVRITAERGQTFLDRMISLVEGASRQKTPNEIALTILLAALTIIFLPVVVVAPALRALLGQRRPGGRPGRAARLPHPDDDRRAAVRHRHRGHGPARAAQRARDERARGRGGRRRRDAAAGQDRHDHARQPDGLRVHRRSAGAASASVAEAAQLASLADETPEGRSIVVLAKDRFNLREPGRSAATSSSRSPRSTRMSARPSAAAQIRKGAADSVRQWVSRPGRDRAAGARRRSSSGSRRAGSTPLVVADGPASRRRHRAEGHRQGGHPGAVRRDAGDGHPDRHDHRRQPAHRGRDRRRGRASTTTSPRRPRSARWPSSAPSRRTASSSR